MPVTARHGEPARPRKHWITTLAALLCLAALLSTDALAAEAFSFSASPTRLAIHGADANDMFGTVDWEQDAVAAGDLNGDGIPDLAVGNTLDAGASNARPDAGAVHVFFGPLLTGQVWDLAIRPADFTILGRDVLDRFGSSVRIGDLNGDGALDLVAGAPNTSRPDLTDTDGGPSPKLGSDPNHLNWCRRHECAKVSAGRLDERSPEVAGAITAHPQRVDDIGKGLRPRSPAFSRRPGSGRATLVATVQAADLRHRSCPDLVGRWIG